MSRVSASTISRLEAGHVASCRVGDVRRVFAALDARLAVVPSWRSGDLDRLVDARHASVIGAATERIGGAPGWDAQPEVTFSIYGERGAIDMLAWHDEARALLVVEAKSALNDVGGLLRQVDRYERLAKVAAGERGWRPAIVGVWVCVPDDRTARRRLRRHELVVRRTLPNDGHDVRRWPEDPRTPLRALSFLPIPAVAQVRRRAPARSTRPAHDGSPVGPRPPASSLTGE